MPKATIESNINLLKSLQQSYSSFIIKGLISYYSCLFGNFNFGYSLIEIQSSSRLIH
jgi:hypothetical protein